MIRRNTKVVQTEFNFIVQILDNVHDDYDGENRKYVPLKIYPFTAAVFPLRYHWWTKTPPWQSYILSSGKLSRMSISLLVHTLCRFRVLLTGTAQPRWRSLGDNAFLCSCTGTAQPRWRSLGDSAFLCSCSCTVFITLTRSTTAPSLRRNQRNKRHTCGKSAPRRGAKHKSSRTFYGGDDF